MFWFAATDCTTKESHDVLKDSHEGGTVMAIGDTNRTTILRSIASPIYSFEHALLLLVVTVLTVLTER
jgi:hypothetical protein